MLHAADELIQDQNAVNDNSRFLEILELELDDNDELDDDDCELLELELDELDDDRELDELELDDDDREDDELELEELDELNAYSGGPSTKRKSVPDEIVKINCFTL